jgi:hypothetical protein
LHIHAIEGKTWKNASDEDNLRSIFTTTTKKDCMKEFNDLPIVSEFYITCRGDSVFSALRRLLSRNACRHRFPHTELPKGFSCSAMSPRWRPAGHHQVAGTNIAHSDSEEERGEHEVFEASELGTPACEIPAHKGAARSGNASQGPSSNCSLQFLARMLMGKWAVEFGL